MIRADHKYNGKISAGSGLVESKTGTVSFNVQLECEDGDAVFPIWLTERNREKSMRYFEVIGADNNKLSEHEYLENELPAAIVGREVCFGTKEEEYNGRTTVKVAWIGKKPDPNLARAAARFFGATDDSADADRPVTDDSPITDSDIPF